MLIVPACKSIIIIIIINFVNQLLAQRELLQTRLFMHFS